MKKIVSKNYFKDHVWSSEINWSFDYEESKQNTVEDAYGKVIAVCTRIGPSPIYKEFIEAMKIIANADGIVDDKESDIINSFSKDLIERFRKDTSIF